MIGGACLDDLGHAPGMLIEIDCIAYIKKKNEREATAPCKEAGGTSKTVDCNAQLTGGLIPSDLGRLRK